MSGRPGAEAPIPGARLYRGLKPAATPVRRGVTGSGGGAAARFYSSWLKPDFWLARTYLRGKSDGRFWEAAKSI